MNKQKIKSHFGLDFYHKMLDILDKYEKSWKLSEYQQIDYYSESCLFYCVSAMYGQCVLKIGENLREIEKEYCFLSECEGKSFCRVYHSDLENGVLLLNCITPGTQLRDETNLDKRLDVFCELFEGLHTTPANKTIYPTYMEWVSRITKYMQTRKDYPELFHKMVAAKQICLELCKKYPGQMLLHGDLHHDNILLGEDNRYYIIDPHGVIGDVVFDIPRFIMNEFEDGIDGDFPKRYAYITHTLAERLKIPEYDIRRLTYVEMCLGNCWMVEDHQEPTMEDVLFTEMMMTR